MEGSYDHGIKFWSSIRGEEFPDWPSDCQLLENVSAPWGSYLVGPSVCVCVLQGRVQDMLNVYIQLST
jgi:hypothetical protein